MKQTDFARIWKSYLDNIRSIRVLSTVILAHALEYDVAFLKRGKERSEQIARILLPDVSSTVESIGRGPTADVLEIENQKKQFMRERLGRVLRDPAQRHHVIKALAGYELSYGAETALGELLKQGILTTLVSVFEALLADILSSYYTKFPCALPPDGLTLTLAELRQLGSLEDAERYIIQKEVDRFLWKSGEEQITSLVERLKLDIKSLNEHLPAIVEIFQRRNAIIHNHGVVNKAYLQKVSQEYIKETRVSEGDHLPVDSTYLWQALDTTCLFGAMLVQTCWRKWEKDGRARADSVLQDLSHELLQTEQHVLLTMLWPCVSALNMVSDNTRRVCAINAAAALKGLAREDEMKTLLDALDWSSVPLRFRVALCMLRDEYELAMSLLPKAVAAEELQLESLVSYPLFRGLWERDDFLRLVKQLFPYMGDESALTSDE